MTSDFFSILNKNLPEYEKKTYARLVKLHCSFPKEFFGFFKKKIEVTHTELTNLGTNYPFAGKNHFHSILRRKKLFAEELGNWKLSLEQQQWQEIYLS